MSFIAPTADAQARAAAPAAPSPAPLLTDASRHVADVLHWVFEHPARQARAVVVYDSASPLAQLLTAAYRTSLPEATFIDFEASTPEAVLDSLAPLQPQDLVVLVQSTSFRLEAFRIRVELFKRGLKVIEHPHLARMPTLQEQQYYVESLAYDPTYYRRVGAALKTAIDGAQRGVLETGGASLVFSGGFESAKLNVGDYRTMANWGGQFPIGEVFTEARDLEQVSGRVRIFVFGDTRFQVNQPATPITLVVDQGQVVGTENSTPEFEQVLANIRADEGVVWVRELGFGLNRAFSPSRTVQDIGTFERMCGVHLSLGAKHGIYAKPNFKRNDGRHHVDVFAATESVHLDGTLLYRDGAWLV